MVEKEEEVAKRLSPLKFNEVFFAANEPIFPNKKVNKFRKTILYCPSTINHLLPPEDDDNDVWESNYEDEEEYGAQKWESFLTMTRDVTLELPHSLILPEIRSRNSTIIF